MAEIALPIIIVVSIATASSLISRESSKMEGINTAPFQPPGWVFGVAWFILYGFVATSWAMVGKSDNYELQNILFLSIGAFLLLWPFAAFTCKNYVIGLLTLLCLIGLTVWLLTLLSYTLSRVFMAIFLGWLVFATVLNVYILWKNRITKFGTLVEF